MTTLDEVDQHLNPYRKKPIWLAKYNTIGALRAAEMFEDHELPRNMHKGGDLGEAVVKKLRAQCPQAVRDGWSTHLIDAFYHTRAIEGIYADVSGPRTRLGIDPMYLSKFKRYKSEHEVKSSIRDGGALSGLAYWDDKTESTKVGIVVNNQGWYFMEVLLDFSSTLGDPAGFPYFSVAGTGNRVDFPGTLESLDIEPQYRFRKFILFLPFLWHEEGKEDFMYAVVSEDWDHLRANGWVNV
jgi:hypothetical protein